MHAKSKTNPFVINPFVHANLIEDPFTHRGISPLSVSLVFNSLASNILNKQLVRLSLGAGFFECYTCNSSHYWI